MTDPLEQSGPPADAPDSPDQTNPPHSPRARPSSAKSDLRAAKQSVGAKKRPAPVGSDAPNRWLTTDPPGEIDALRSSSSLGHRPLPKRGRWRRQATLLMVVLAAAAGVAVGQLGYLDSFFSSTPDVVDNQVIVESADEIVTVESEIRTALISAGFGDLTIDVVGDMAVVSGMVADEESLSAAALTVLNVPGVAQLDNRLEIGTAAIPTAEATLATALGGEEFAYVSFDVQNRLVVLQGAVPTEETRARAALAALGVEGIDKIDNRLVIEADLPIGPTLPPEQLEAAAATALAGAGFQTVTASVEGRQAVLAGTVPLETLGGGFFEFVEQAQTAVLSVDGIDQVSSRLTLRGDGSILRSELRALLQATPVEFALGSSDLTAQSQAVLDQAALVIQSQPGVQVFIAGHTDTAGSNETNELLSRQRAGAVRDYLLTRGVPSYRLLAVSYGELFPDQEATDEQNRRIEFEVGP